MQTIGQLGQAHLDKFFSDTILPNRFVVLQLLDGILNFSYRWGWHISVACCIDKVTSFTALVLFLYAIQMFIEVLLPPFGHLTIVRQNTSILIPTHFGSRHEAFTGSVEFLVKLTRFMRAGQLF